MTSVPTTTVGGVYKVGVNLGPQDFSGCCGGNFMQNMFENPGFEPSTDGHLINVSSGVSSTSFTDSTDNGASTNYCDWSTNDS